MRAFGTFILGILVAIAAIILVIFAVENTRTEQFSFLGGTFTADLWLIAVIPAIVGFILALLLTTPARAALDSQHRALGRRYRDLDRQYGSIRQQHESLMSQHAALQSERDAMREEHTRLLASHDDLRSRMAAMSSERPTERVTRERVTEPVTERMDERAPEPVVERVDARPRDRTDRTDRTDHRREDETVEERTAPDGAAGEEREVVRETAPQHRPSLGERVRGWLRPERPAEQDYPNGPLAPTA
ncbi:MAG TPA: hypothetical protein VLJ14_03800 [Ktedonobacterales bacterium]|nr:hypothetical protein [Ktedonobacterales bacterium]